MGHPLAFAAFLESIGSPHGRNLHRHGMPDSGDPRAFVPLERAWAFFDAAARCEDPLLGWHVGRFRGGGNIGRGLLSNIVRAPTLLEALERLLRLCRTEASHLTLGIRGRRDDVLMFTQYQMMKGAPGYHASQAYQLGIFIDLIRRFAGPDWLPDEMGIEYPEVPAEVKRLFPGVRILARQPMGYVTIPRSCLLLPPRAPTGGGAEADLGPADRLDYVGTLRALLEPHLSHGRLTATLAASLMGTSVRTLKRRLSARRTTFRAVIDELRFSEARRLLASPDLRIIDVAGAVGFEDPAHFSRMFRRVGDVSPREFRRTAVGSTE
jgi:AraC-like DNA-binding protein